MVDAIFLVKRNSQGVTNDRNLIREVLIFNDDQDADALIIQNTVDALNLADPVESNDGANPEPVYPDFYFDTVVQVGASPAGPFDTEFDFLAYAPAVLELETPD